MVDVTDSMVARCHAEALKWNTALPDETAVRAWLEAALTEPPELEVVVTREMADAGGKAYRECRDDETRTNRAHRGAVGWSTNDYAHAIYRAMRRLEPAPAAIKADVGTCDHATQWESGYWLPFAESAGGSGGTARVPTHRRCPGCGLVERRDIRPHGSGE